MDIGDPQSLNRYAYVGGDPVNSNDPLGLRKQKICMLLDNGDDSNFCVGLWDLTEDPFYRDAGMLGSFPITYIPGRGYVFTGGPSAPDLGGSIPGGCILPGGCPGLPWPSIGDLIPRMPWDNPCALSPISDGCGFDNIVLKKPEIAGQNGDCKSDDVVCLKGVTDFTKGLERKCSELVNSGHRAKTELVVTCKTGSDTADDC